MFEIRNKAQNLKQGDLDKLNEVRRHLAIRTLLTEEEKKVGNMSCSEENLQTQRKMQHSCDDRHCNVLMQGDNNSSLNLTKEQIEQPYKLLTPAKSTSTSVGPERYILDSL
ncbi:hypothetical protein CK203_104997 [Vitis vinifera]|uniref:Uncharacterized protein n=1 Tax=Vitis vinifera TaxID=29760 RepID=A0A438CWT1_VITVI|nr:hypothetical protein CK203_104997 [Vitis vinifera]